MDEFQRQFFLLRSSEWERYRSESPYTRQGDLSDPTYFDFISFAQFATISNLLRSTNVNNALFEEKVGAEGSVRVVRRDFSAYPDQVSLIRGIESGTGKRVFEKISNELEISATDVSQKIKVNQLQPAVKRLFDFFVKKGFAYSVDVEWANDKTGRERSDKYGENLTLRVSWENPVNAWSMNFLGVRGDLKNSYDVFVLREWLNSVGYRGRVSTKTRKDAVVQDWQIFLA